MDNFIPLISLLSSELEKNRINMINDLKSILLKSSEEVEVFIKIFESWVTKLPSISGPLNLYIPTSFKDKSIEVESYGMSIFHIMMTNVLFFLQINLLLNLVRRNLWIIVSNI